MDFHKLKVAMARRFDGMRGNALFLTAVDRDGMWAHYLSSFPEGTNPTFRKRTEHDCSCCRQFVRAMGAVVSIRDDRLVSVWDVECGEPGYQAVADAMSAHVKAMPVADVFLSSERTAGTDRSHEQADGRVRTWDHFFLEVSPHGRNDQRHFCEGAMIATRQSEARSTHDVLRRALEEVDGETVATVLELIRGNAIYRGEEHRFVVDAFDKLRREYLKAPEADRDAFVWSRVGTVPAAVAHVRSSVIGTLMTDLAAGKAMEDAVRLYESKVAPANYKRPTALVTKRMVEEARAKVAELGLTSALERRYAHLSDVTVNDLLFVDRATRKVMTGDVFDAIAVAPLVAADGRKVEDILAEDFFAHVLPVTESLEVLLEDRHAGNLVSLIAPVHADAERLFKWDNGFSWSYDGDVADSMREKVKRAGGDVTGELCCRLAWHNLDDLDLHMLEPGGHEIYYGNRHQASPSGGCLDVDMNAGSGTTREPVENVFYAAAKTMREGEYHLFVHQYRRRESVDVGFEVELDHLGSITSFAHPQAVRQDQKVTVARFAYTRKGGMRMIESLPSSRRSRKVWGVDTGAFHRVNALMHSPNHWGGQGVGNRHWFLMIDGCENEGNARGFYNEFLRPELDRSRKVLEIVGSKMRTQEATGQLSGLGFSTTRRDEFTVRVRGGQNRDMRVVV